MKQEMKQEIKKQTFSVPEMHCPACVMLLEGLEDELEGVEMVNANYHRQKMEVEFDEKKVGMTEIIEAARKEGYRVVPINE